MGLRHLLMDVVLFDLRRFLSSRLDALLGFV